MEPVKVFLDTNVVIDFYTGRTVDDNAKTIIATGQDPQLELCISILTAINVLYISKKFTPALQASNISELFSILPMDYQQYCNAQSSNIKDFEDALQITCASSSDCRAIVTRDKEILESGIRFPLILSPEEYLREVGL